MQHDIAHDLGRSLARRVTRKALDSYKKSLAEYSPQGRWISDDKAEVAFTVLGRELTGTIEVYDDRIGLDLEVPLMWQMFRGIAVQVIEKEIRTWIDRARAGELDDE